MTITEALTQLLADLAADCRDPLAERLMVATIWADLARIAGEDVPAPVLRLIEGGADELPQRRKSHDTEDAHTGP